MSREEAETQAIVAEEAELRSPLLVHPTSPSVSYMIKPQGRKKPLTLWGAVAIIFYSVSGKLLEKWYQIFSVYEDFLSRRSIWYRGRRGGWWAVLGSLGIPHFSIRMVLARGVSHC